MYCDIILQRIQKSIVNKSRSFTVQDTRAPNVQITKAVDKKGVLIAESRITKSHYTHVTFASTDAVGVEKVEYRLDAHLHHVQVL